MARVEVTVDWNSAAVQALGRDTSVAALMDRVAAFAVQAMKKHTPVSPVGPLHRSGNLRSSVTAFRQADGSILIGPDPAKAPYAPYVEDDTRPHFIVSHGNYPLRNRESGKVFGRIVHHPGTRGAHFLEKTADDLNGLRVTL